MVKKWRTYLSCALLLLGLSVASNDLRDPVSSTGCNPFSYVSSYDKKTKRILLVPGHDDEYGGCRGKAGQEENINLAIAEDIKFFLDRDSDFVAEITRSTSGYTKPLRDFLDSNRKELRERALDILREESSELVERYTRNFGLAEYSNRKKPDLTIHVHVNNDPTDSTLQGFVTFWSQYNNSYYRSRKFAAQIRNKLASEFPMSTSPAERHGISARPYVVLGSPWLRVKPPSVLVEYGYINDTTLAIPQTQMDAAFLTYQAVKAGFNK